MRRLTQCCLLFPPESVSTEGCLLVSAGGGGGQQREEVVDQSVNNRGAASTESEHPTLPRTYLDNHHLDGDVIRQSDRRSEVLGQRHQQVQDGNDTLGVDS